MSTGRIWATPAAKELYGFARDLDVTFDMFLGVVHPQDVERVRDRIARALKSRLRLRTNTGSSARWQS